MDIGLVDLVERAEALPVVAHAVDEHVLGSLGVADQILRRLGQSGSRQQADRDREQGGNEETVGVCGNVLH